MVYSYFVACHHCPSLLTAFLPSRFLCLRHVLEELLYPIIMSFLIPLFISTSDVILVTPASDKIGIFFNSGQNCMQLFI